MESVPITETAGRVVLERDIPEPAVAGLVEFIDRYYIRSKTRFIEALSYRKTVRGTGLGLFWIFTPAGPERATPLAVRLKISQAGIVVDLPSLDPNDRSI